jgi:ATP-dependent DNA helicase RecG
MKAMRVKKIYQTLSKRAKELLARDEGVDVDWKQTDKFDSEDIVAFANSFAGGAILLGVAETKGPNGRQVPKIIGCDISDNSKLKIINKAGDCYPPIHVELFIENANSLPFWRIEIPAGKHKPYSTKSGIYKTRGDGKNASLLPDDLLSLYLQEQGTRFNESFKTATTEIDKLLNKLNSEVTDYLIQLFNKVELMRVNIEMKLFDISHDFEQSIESANEQLASAIGSIPDEISESIESYTSESGDSIISKVEILENELGEVSKTTGIVKLAVDELLKKQGLDDSVTIYWRRIIHQSIGMFNGSNKRFQKDGLEEMPFEEYYEHMLAVYPKLDRAFLLSLINEKLPDFKPATKKRKSI